MSSDLLNLPFGCGIMSTLGFFVVIIFSVPNWHFAMIRLHILVFSLKKKKVCSLTIDALGPPQRC